jgi:FkbH-like protein
LTAADLYWLPELATWSDLAGSFSDASRPAWPDLVSLAKARIDMVKTARLDRLLRRSFPQPPAGAATGPVRLAVLASSTIEHLLPGIRVGALRRNIWLECYVGNYGQYLQELLNQNSALHLYAPDTVLFAFDAAHIFGGVDPAMTAAQADTLLDQQADRIAGLWRLAREHFGCHVIQQTILPVFADLAGSNEHRLAGSRANLVHRLNARLRIMADAQGADVLAIDTAAARSGIAAWYDQMLWHRAKQEISPRVAPLYGDLLARLLTSRRGLSFKCLALDLDNTLWGGVIGDDGMDGIKLGQGSALGEAHVAFQLYCKDLSRRGVILAVCSKNDDANARAPFESHPEMILRLPDIACFIANWSDKPNNLRTIAERLNIGIDAIAFADDNVFERTIVRRELPMVAVPELPEDPGLYAAAIADAGYFETVGVTPEDFERAGQYQANLQREQARASFTDMAGYLKSLDMVLTSKPFDPVGLPRIVQLINKTNQFNLTTRRTTDADARSLMADPHAVTMQLRLVDNLGDNGMISVVIARAERDNALVIDTWLMSCRVLGRQVEEATMNLLVQAAARLGLPRIIGHYIPTAKNGMVRDHYRKLGFHETASDPDGTTSWALDLSAFKPFSVAMTIKEGSCRE